MKGQSLAPISDPLRPDTLAGLVGQREVVDALTVLLDGAQSRGELPRNMLLIGPPGTGKTTLALIIARSIGGPLVEFIGPQVRKISDVLVPVLGAQPRTTMFIDEIHRVYRPVQEYLFPVMEDHVLVSGGNRAQLPPLLWVGATTDPSRLLTPYLDRFTILQLSAYTKADLATIAINGAAKLGCTLDPDAARLLAAHAEGTPRVVLKMMTTARDYAYAEKEKAGVRYQLGMTNRERVTIGKAAVRAVLDSPAFVWRQDGRTASDR